MLKRKCNYKVSEKHDVFTHLNSNPRRPVSRLFTFFNFDISDTEHTV